jgi:cytochrome c oxidase subunit II
MRDSNSTPPASRGRARRKIGQVAAMCTLVLTPLAASGCGGGARSSTPAAPLSAAAERGRQTALESGCASCHGATWQGGVAPAWVGLAGSTVTLSDGSTVTADADYLARSIIAPADDKVSGFTVVMPTNALTADQVADVVAFIQTLTPSEDA